MITPYSTADFTYDKVTRTMATEASDLENFAATSSIWVKSAKTRTVLEFRFVRTERDAEGDTIAWHYLSTIGEFKLVVFND